MPQPIKYPHQRQLDFLYANKGIGISYLGEEISDEVIEWQRVWIEKGKPNANLKLTGWSNEIVQLVDEYLSDYEDEIFEELAEGNTAVVVKATIPSIKAGVSPSLNIKTSARISPNEQALEKLYNNSQTSATKKQLGEAGFDPGIFGWSSTGWDKGKKYILKKAKRDSVYTIVKV